MDSISSTSGLGKRRYHLSDWKSYNKGLCQRYSLEVWFNEEVISNWYHKPLCYKQGANLVYSPQAILTCLQLRALFGFLRATQGFLDSLFARLKLPIKCPHYSQLCRRAKEVNDLPLFPSHNTLNALFALIDSTGLKVYGQGEWHVKMRRSSKRRTWRKLHLIDDPVSQEIITHKLTCSKVHDVKVLMDLLPKLPTTITRLWGDGAYDSSHIYKVLDQRGIYPMIPPPANAAPSCKYYRTRRYLGKTRLIHQNPPMLPRDLALAYIHQYSNLKEEIKQWKKHSFYHLRSLAETAMMRFKRIFSDKLRSRTLINQQAEVKIKCHMLNKMLQIASARSQPIRILA